MIFSLTEKMGARLKKIFSFEKTIVLGIEKIFFVTRKIFTVKPAIFTIVSYKSGRALPTRSWLFLEFQLIRTDRTVYVL